MAKNKYATEYPAILKEKAKAAGVKVKKADYRFLDHFMLIQEEAEYPDVKLDLLEESEEIVLNFITYQRAVIQMKMAAHDASEIGFVSVIKLVRQITGLGLKETKELVETAPDAMIVASSRQDARWLCKELLEIGAQAEIA